MLSVNNLAITFDGRTILDGVSFTLRPGEFVSLVGPNGAGKTTLLRCLMRIYQHWSGDVTWHGVSARRFGFREWARYLAYLPQNDPIEIPYTVEEFVLMARYPYGNPFSPPSPEDRQAAREALLLTETWPCRHRVVKTLSGGERQRVLLAAVLAQQAQLLLLDEATTFLDYRHRTQMQVLLRRVNRENGVTILAATHDLNAAVLTSDRILALRDGRLLFDGTPHQLMRPDVLRQLFDVEPVLVPHPQTGVLMLLPTGGGDQA